MSIVIVAAKRTPIGCFQGCFSEMSAPQLAACSLRSCLESVTLDPFSVDEAYLGNVLSAGLGQAPARQAVLAAGLPKHVGATTLNKVCGSGMKAVMAGANALRLNEIDIAVVGGMENMTRAPHLSRIRQGVRMGSVQFEDHLFLDGLEDAYEQKLMGIYAQKTADEYGLTRQEMDQFATISLQRAQQARLQGHFHSEIAPVSVNGAFTVVDDELPLKSKPEKIPHLKPVFSPTGTITAANSSAISDGAASLILMRKVDAHALNLVPLARICGYVTHAGPPHQFTLAPIDALRKLSAQTGWSLGQVDLFEINEAFAMVTMLAMQQLDLRSEKVNVHGGACALGHPLGATGARIIVTLVHALHTRSLRKGMACLCIGGGEATAIAIERI